MASSRNVRQPAVDAVLVSKLEAKYGKRLLTDGYTGVPVLVQRYYRQVPGNARDAYEYDYHPFYKAWVKNEESKRRVCEVSYMTPTEYAIMADIWSYWWYGDSQPWPAISEIAAHVGKSIRQVRRYLQRMQDSGWLFTITQYNAEGKQVSNRYDFSPFLRRLVEYLETIGVLEKPMQSTREDVIFTTERVSERPERRVSERPPESDESQTDESEEDESKIRGGRAAEPEKGGGLPNPPETLARPTIGSLEALQGTETTNKDAQLEPSNPSNDEETGGPARVKEVEAEKTGKQARTFEEMASLLGVASEAVEDMRTWLQQHPRPDALPIKLQGQIPQWSRQLGNAEPRLVAANLSQAAKIYQYARLRGLSQQVTEHCLEDAREAVRHHPNAKIPMAFFFTSLKLAVLVALQQGRTAPPGEHLVFDGYDDPQRPQTISPGMFLRLSDEARQQVVTAQRTQADQQYTDLGIDRETLMAMDPAARIAFVKQAQQKAGA